MRKAIAYVVFAGAVGMFVGIAEVQFGRSINSNLFLVGAVLCFGGEMILKYTRR